MDKSYSIKTFVQEGVSPLDSSVVDEERQPSLLACGSATVRTVLDSVHAA